MKKVSLLIGTILTIANTVHARSLKCTHIGSDGLETKYEAGFTDEGRGPNARISFDEKSENLQINALALLGDEASQKTSAIFVTVTKTDSQFQTISVKGINEAALNMNSKNPSYPNVKVDCKYSQ